MSDVRNLNAERMIQCFVGEEVYCVGTSRLRGIQRSEGFSLNDNGSQPDGWLTGRRAKMPVFSWPAAWASRILRSIVPAPF